MEEEEQLSFMEKIPNFIKVAFFVFAIILIIAGSFYMGGYYTCTKANGTMVGQIKNMDCYKIRDLGTCIDSQTGKTMIASQTQIDLIEKWA